MSNGTDNDRAHAPMESEAGHPSETGMVLLPCPFCGGAAHFDLIAHGLDDVNPRPDEGGEFVVCGTCGCCTSLRFPLMDDVKRELAEQWNRRECRAGG